MEDRLYGREWEVIGSVTIPRSLKRVYLPTSRRAVPDRAPEFLAPAERRWAAAAALGAGPPPPVSYVALRQPRPRRGPPPPRLAPVRLTANDPSAVLARGNETTAAWDRAEAFVQSFGRDPGPPPLAATGGGGRGGGGRARGVRRRPRGRHARFSSSPATSSRSDEGSAEGAGEGEGASRGGSPGDGGRTPPWAVVVAPAMDEDAAGGWGSTSSGPRSGDAAAGASVPQQLAALRARPGVAGKASPAAGSAAAPAAAAAAAPALPARVGPRAVWDVLRRNNRFKPLDDDLNSVDTPRTNTLAQTSVQRARAVRERVAAAASAQPSAGAETVAGVAAAGAPIGMESTVSSVAANEPARVRGVPMCKEDRCARACSLTSSAHPHTRTP